MAPGVALRRAGLLLLSEPGDAPSGRPAAAAAGVSFENPATVGATAAVTVAADDVLELAGPSLLGVVLPAEPCETRAVCLCEEACEVLLPAGESDTAPAPLPGEVCAPIAPKECRTESPPPPEGECTRTLSTAGREAVRALPASAACRGAILAHFLLAGCVATSYAALSGFFLELKPPADVLCRSDATLSVAAPVRLIASAECCGRRAGCVGCFCKASPAREAAAELGTGPAGTDRTGAALGINPAPSDAPLPSLTEDILELPQIALAVALWHDVRLCAREGASAGGTAALTAEPAVLHPTAAVGMVRQGGGLCVVVMCAVVLDGEGFRAARTDCSSSLDGAGNDPSTYCCQRLRSGASCMQTSR